jgi:protease YdgD
MGGRKSNRAAMVFAVLGAAVLLASLTSAAEAASVSLSASRRVVDSSSVPWSSIGKLFNSAGGSCSAFVVSEERVVTAAHCLFNFKTGKFLPAQAIHILLGYDKGRYRIHARVKDYTIGKDYDPKSEKKTLASDWALMRLSEPLTDTVPLTPAHSSARIGLQVTLAGYERRRAYVLSADLGCHIVARLSEDIFVSDCMAQPGDSGGPILVREADSGYRVVGIQVASIQSSATRNRRLSLAVSGAGWNDAVGTLLPGQVRHAFRRADLGQGFGLSDREYRRVTLATGCWSGKLELDDATFASTSLRR